MNRTCAVARKVCFFSVLLPLEWIIKIMSKFCFCKTWLCAFVEILMRSWEFLEHLCCNVYAVLWEEVCALLVVREHRIFPVGSVCPEISPPLLYSEEWEQKQWNCLSYLDQRENYYVCNWIWVQPSVVNRWFPSCTMQDTIEELQTLCTSSN